MKKVKPDEIYTPAIGETFEINGKIVRAMLVSQPSSCELCALDFANCGNIQCIRPDKKGSQVLIFLEVQDDTK